MGDITESETFLQLAARWSQDSYDESISIGNLGSLHLLQSDWNVNMSQKYTYQAWQQEFNEGFRVKIDRNENVNTAINYWDDAIKLFTDGRQTEVVRTHQYQLLNFSSFYYASFDMLIDFCVSQTREVQVALPRKKCCE